MEEERPRLNQPLDVDKLEICVPKKSRLHFSDPPPANASDDKLLAAWEIYRKDQGCRQGSYEYPKKCECWAKLKGQCAVRHAVTVHEKIQRQILRLPGVSATDVGFAILEHSHLFENVLAIRIHVTKKLTRWQLLKAGIPDLTDPRYAPSSRKDGDHEHERTSRLHKVCEKLGILAEDLEEHLFRDAYQRYPIVGVGEDDLRYEEPVDATSPEKLPHSHCPRLQVCGVPLDIVQAKYFPSSLNSGSEACDGVFAGAPQTSAELSNEEQLLTGRCRVNPLVGGISVGSVTGQAGTLSTIVWDRTDGTPCLLSNWHVLAGSAAAMIGQPCYQPALFDGGTEADTVAHLKRWHLGELGDAAIAELANARQYASGEIMGMWHPLAGYQDPELNMEVLKWGRTTGFTQGFVDGIHLATSIDYGNGMVRYFKDQFHIAPLYSGCDVSQVGDSGSLVLTCRKLVPLTKEEQAEALAEVAALSGKAQLESDPLKCFRQHLKELGFDVDAVEAAHKDKKRREKPHAYLIVGMIFAGDTPGSPFGEFALASNVRLLAKELQFSLRPVFEPRSSFRKVRTEPPGRGPDRDTGTRGSRAPGAQGIDPRGKGPQPDGESTVTGPGSKP